MSIAVALTTFAAGFAQVSAPGTAPGCPHGKAHGMWQLPSPGTDGHAGGVLLGPNGHPLFALEGKLAWQPSPAHPGVEGVFDGQLKWLGAPGTPNPTVAHAHGKWIAGVQGQGHFEIALLQPVPGPGGPQLLGKIKGAFVDPNPPGGANPVGKFKGGWILCP